MTTHAKTDDDPKATHSRAKKSAAEKEPPKRPAMIHPAPHITGIKHKPGEDPDEVRDERKKALEDARADDDEAPVPTVDESFTDARAQELYGLRKQGRLFRCEQEGLPELMVEADDEEQAREAYCTEIEARTDRHETRKGKKGKKGEEMPVAPLSGPVALPAGLPPGTTITLGTGELPALDKNKVKVVKLTP